MEIKKNQKQMGLFSKNKTVAYNKKWCITYNFLLVAYTL